MVQCPCVTCRYWLRYLSPAVTWPLFIEPRPGFCLSLTLCLVKCVSILIIISVACHYQNRTALITRELVTVVRCVMFTQTKCQWNHHLEILIVCKKKAPLMVKPLYKIVYDFLFHPAEVPRDSVMSLFHCQTCGPVSHLAVSQSNKQS